MEEQAKRIIWHYGLIPQLKYMQSEIFEFNEAILEYYHNYEESVDHIEEEFADVLVMLLQIKEYFGLDEKDLKEIMQQKIDRQLMRMGEGK